MDGEMHLAELMAARLCHDLVGPIGAVANGVELLGDGSAGGDPEVTGLIAVSARQATRRLQWFRVAFGSASGLPNSGMFAETRRLALGLFEEGRVSLDWSMPDPAIEALATRAAAKVSLNLSLSAIECLPRGGAVQVRIAPDTAALRIRVAALGTGARMPDDLEMALREGVAIPELTPKSIPAYLAARLAKQLGGRLSAQASGEDRIEFAVDLPIRA